LSGRGLCDELITRPEESYRLCCVVVCDLETSRMGAPYINDISHLRVKRKDIHHLYTELLYQYTRGVVTQDTSEIRDILGVRSMNTTKEQHGYVRASLMMEKDKKIIINLKPFIQKYLQISQYNVTNYYI